MLEKTYALMNFQVSVERFQSNFFPGGKVLNFFRKVIDLKLKTTEGVS